MEDVIGVQRYTIFLTWAKVDHTPSPIRSKKFLANAPSFVFLQKKRDIHDHRNISRHKTSPLHPTGLHKKNEETKSSPLRFTLLVQVQLDPNIPHIDTLYATCVV